MNKLLITSLLILLTSFNAWSQGSYETLQWDGIERSYFLYVPAHYDQADPASLLITLHGLGDQIENFSNIGFQEIADTTNLILVVPQAIEHAVFSTAWNSGAGFMGIYPNETIDDVGFINHLVEVIEEAYSIDSEKVYLTGFSMGGFMTSRMACEAPEKFAAFGVVAGTLGSAITDCSPQRKSRLIQLHGTMDQVVGYNNNNFGLAVNDYLTQWLQINEITSEALVTSIDNNSNDGYEITKYKYISDDDIDVVHYKVEGADHIWLSQPFNGINYTEELWHFFNDYETPISIEEPKLTNSSFNIYPNPTNGTIYIQQSTPSEYTLKIYDYLGKELVNKNINAITYKCDLSGLGLSSGMYFLKLQFENHLETYKVILQ